jgi:hypothetical protein
LGDVAIRIENRQGEPAANPLEFDCRECFVRI